eukprot:CAMPEP_0119003768 /NCGR_PEP_ID=MMETSP1176-20130426/750_1 /TAXON_ID=265551 /ORGANISM="Synedropsis recta cf, Strain CCMP1620" /LENGTH=330 /DNA_ID=CAMNT_0006955393 /DNA_START=38 /DNA_END=1030 /DNA_ORIENTATION=-
MMIRCSRTTISIASTTLLKLRRSCFSSSSSCKIVEVGPRDGLQNESKMIVSTANKVKLIHLLTKAGCSTIEVGAFVSATWVPQMADSMEVLEAIGPPPLLPQVSYSCLVPNVRGMALAASNPHCTEVAIFASASESFSQKNINCSIAKSMERFEPVMDLAAEKAMPVRGYVSCVVGCPYEGAVDIKKVCQVSEQLLEMGCYEVSLGDTIGVGTPNQIKDLLQALQPLIPADKLAVHFHDTYGQALANILVALEQDVRTIDSSVAGLGGCPYAKGASGNVATEDVVYMLHGMGMETNIDLDALVDAGSFISNVLGKESDSKVARAMLAKRI